MKIRSLISTLAIMLLIASGASAQKNAGSSKFREANLKGIWQMCVYIAESQEVAAELKPSNTFKVLSGDGHITNFTYRPNVGAVITGEGGYRQTSDTTYVESISRSIHLPMLNHKENKLIFEIENDKYLHLKYYIEKDENDNVIDAWYHETWVKLAMPDRYPEDLVR